MTYELYKIITFGIITFLVIWLIYRIKNRLQIMIKNEIYTNFPSIRIAIDNFEHRLQQLKNQMEILENKIKELENKARTN